MSINTKDAFKNDIQSTEVDSETYNSRPTIPSMDYETKHSERERTIAPSLGPKFSDVLIGISSPNMSASATVHSLAQSWPPMMKPPKRDCLVACNMANKKVEPIRHPGRVSMNSNLKMNETTRGEIIPSDLNTKQTNALLKTESSAKNQPDIFTTVIQNTSAEPNVVMDSGLGSGILTSSIKCHHSESDKRTQLGSSTSLILEPQLYTSSRQSSSQQLEITHVNSRKMLNCSNLLSKLNENMQTRSPYACSFQNALVHRQNHRKSKQCVHRYDSLLSLATLTHTIKSETKRDSENHHRGVIPSFNQHLIPNGNFVSASLLLDNRQRSDDEKRRTGEDSKTLEETDVNNNQLKTSFICQPGYISTNKVISSSEKCSPRSIFSRQVEDNHEEPCETLQDGNQSDNVSGSVNLCFWPCSKSSYCTTSDQVDEVLDALSNEGRDGDSKPYTIQTEPISSENDQSSDNNDNKPRKPERRKISRKPANPLRSPPKWDPSFRGVTVQMKTKLRPDGSHLSISSYFNYRKVRSKWRRPSRYRHKAHNYSHSTSMTTDRGLSDQEECANNNKRENRLCFYYSSTTGKQCASCNARKTPLWRDAEDGTPLCNACGIRYKKYRVRCVHCWHIPKKDSKAYPDCPNCGCQLRYTLVRRFDPLLPLKGNE